MIYPRPSSPLSFHKAPAGDSVTAPMRPSENNVCYGMPLARDRHDTVPWQMCSALCHVLERWGRSLTPCFRPLQQAVIKAMARGVRAAPALEKET